MKLKCGPSGLGLCLLLLGGDVHGLYGQRDYRFATSKGAAPPAGSEPAGR